MGISLKLQEEEREKRLDYIPDISAVDIMIADGIEIDTDTREMLSSMDMQNLQGLNVVNSKDQGRRGYGDRPRGDRPVATVLVTKSTALSSLKAAFSLRQPIKTSSE